ncbi:hypothetical protein INR49_007631 [Caranx melampygus]|nr:hypothetical protein INR49_007631 [Caranx melampygus]
METDRQREGGREEEEEEEELNTIVLWRDSSQNKTTAIQDNKWRDEQDEEEQQDDLNADDEQLGEEVGQHRLHGAHTWGRDATKHPCVYRLRSKPLIGRKK